MFEYVLIEKQRLHHLSRKKFTAVHGPPKRFLQQPVLCSLIQRLQHIQRNNNNRVKGYTT